MSIQTLNVNYSDLRDLPKSYMFEFSVQKVTCLNLVYKVENPSNSREGEGGAFKSNTNCGQV